MSEKERENEERTHRGNGVRHSEPTGKSSRSTHTDVNREIDQGDEGWERKKLLHAAMVSTLLVIVRSHLAGSLM